MGLDTVELVLGWEAAFGIPIDEGATVRMRTTSDAIDYIYAAVRGAAPEDTGYLALRAFYRIRGRIGTHLPDGTRLRPATKLSDVFTSRSARSRVSEMLSGLGFSPLPPLPFGLQWISRSIGHLIAQVVITDSAVLRKPGHGWSRVQVREVARAVMFAQFSLRRFSDHARVVKDLGLD
jgi:hypothetical protein